MNNKTIYRIIYGIIILCIVCIILVSVLSTGNKEWDWGLGISSVIGIIVSVVYLIYKNKKTAKVAPDSLPNSLLSSADNENSKENLNNNEQKRIQIQNVQEQRDLDIKREREIKQALILEIINENKNNTDMIPSLIINKIFNTTYDFDFFKNYQSEYLIPIQNVDNIETIKYISSILLLYNQLTYDNKYQYRNAEDDKTRESIINNPNNQKIPEHIESVVTTKSKLSDEVTSKFITDVQENQENNYELNNIITNYIKYLQTQTINVMNLFRQNVEDKIQDVKLWNIIWQKAWMVDKVNDPDRDPNSLGTGDR